MNKKNTKIKFICTFIQLICLFYFIPQNLYSDEIMINFNDNNGMEYDGRHIELYKGKVRLSPTGFWTNTGELTNVTMPIMLFQDSQENLFYGTTPMSGGGCIYKSENYGNNWKVVYNNQRCDSIFEASDNNLYACMYFGEGVKKSYDNGNSWGTILSGGSSVETLFEDSFQHLYASINSYHSVPSWTTNYLWKSTNYGTNWTLIYKDGIIVASTGISFTWIFELNNNNLIAGRSSSTSIPSGIYLSSNYGTNWSLISETSNYRYGKNIFRASNNSIYVFGYNGIIKSANEDKNWLQVSNEPCNMLIEANEGIFYKTPWSGSGINVFKSFDKGYTWQKTSNLIKDSANFGKHIGGLIQADDGRIYVGGATNQYRAGYVFRNAYPTTSEIIINITPDFVNQWESFSKSDTLNNGNINYQFSYSTDKGNSWSSWLPLDDFNLQTVICSGSGKDQLRIKITLSSHNHDTTPEIDWISIKYYNELMYHQFCNYPNPFDPNKEKTCIEYLLPGNDDVKILIYQIGGKIIKKWKFNKGTAGGIGGLNRFYWDGRSEKGYKVAIGVYFCFLKYGNTENMIKILVLK